MLTLNRVLASSAIAFIVLFLVALMSGSEQTSDAIAVWASRAFWVFLIAGAVWVFRMISSTVSRKPPLTSTPNTEATLDVWHATLWAQGQEHHEDRVGQDAAQAWVAEKCKELSYSAAIQWQCAEDACTATIPPDGAATVRRRKAT